MKLPFVRSKKPRWPIKRVLLEGLGGMLGLQAITLAILQVATVIRKKGVPQTGFDHPELPEVELSGNKLRIYAYGQDLYEAMLAAIDGARETIYFETFIWKGDEVGQRFKDHLARKAAEGVAVYAIYDSFGNLVVPPSFKQFPESMHVLAYTGITRPWHAIDPRHYAFEHRKLLAVDGRIGFLGGYNIGSDYATKWRDTHLSVTGPDAADLADEFARFWNDHCRPEERISRRYHRRFNPTFHSQESDAMRMTFPIRDMYIEAIDNAEERIRLTNAYFAPDSSLFGALIAAAGRGVDVQVLVPWISNHASTDWLARGYFTDALKAGIRVFCYKRMLHAKTCTIDGQWSTIGTANLDRLSAVGNYEINVELYSQELARQMEAVFEADLSCAFELHLDEWQRRPWLFKLGEHILAPLRAVM